MGRRSRSRLTSVLAFIGYALSRIWTVTAGIASSHVYAAILSLIPIVAGIAGGALFSGDYSKVWPYNGIEISQSNYPGNFLNLEAGVFYGSIIIFAAMLYLREAAIKYRADKRDTEFLDTLRTMPPRNVMLKFGMLYNGFNDLKCAAINDEGERAEKLQSIGDAIRYGVDTMTNIAFLFMHEPPNARYAGNIMLYRPITDIPDRHKPDVLNKLESFIETRTLSGLDGILELQVELSSSTDEKDDPFSRDPHLKKEIALPVPEPQFSVHNNKKRYLPGAPTALYEDYHLIDDTHEILENYYEENEYDVAPSIFENIDHYFKSEDGKLIRSFFSVALTGLVGQQEGKLGVVNIHCSEPKMFGKQNYYISESYVMLCQPFLTGISELLIARAGLLGNEPTLE